MAKTRNAKDPSPPSSPAGRLLLSQPCRKWIEALPVLVLALFLVEISECIIATAQILGTVLVHGSDA